MTKRVFGMALFVVLVSVTAIIGLSGCGDHHDTLEEKMHEPSAETGSAEQEETITRHWIQQDSVAVSVGEGPSAYVLSRTESIEQYPCGNCHVSESVVQSSGSRKSRQAHWDVEIHHGHPGEKRSFECATCHASGNPATLTTPGGDTVSLNQSQKLCGDCHQKQLKDWKGGAHGKQRTYWQGPRVMYSCAECHNPHDPAIKKRWPVTVPSIPRKSGRSRK
ncbi:MAG: hypothetical protein ABEK50_14065 [bacterium]